MFVLKLLKFFHGLFQILETIELILSSKTWYQQVQARNKSCFLKILLDMDKPLKIKTHKKKLNGEYVTFQVAESLPVFIKRTLTFQKKVMKTWCFKRKDLLDACVLQWIFFSSSFLWMGYIAQLNQLPVFFCLGEWKHLIWVEAFCWIDDPHYSAWLVHVKVIYGFSVLMFLQRLVKLSWYMCVGKDAYRITYELPVSFTVEVTQ